MTDNQSNHNAAVILTAFQKDQPQHPVSNVSNQSPGGRSLTAATLIDAIIIHQINRTTPENGFPSNGSGGVGNSFGGGKSAGISGSPPGRGASDSSKAMAVSAGLCFNHISFHSLFWMELTLNCFYFRK